MRRNTKIRLLLNILSISYLLLGGLFFVPHASAEGTRNIGETCNGQIQCKTGLACDDGFCTCNDIGSTPSNHCAAAYPTADAWRCINEAEDPDKSREEWNFCKKADYISSLPKNSTEDVKYPVETKALLGYPCGNDDDVCWDPGGSAGACKKTINASVQSPPTDKFYDPWYTQNSSLYVCALSTGAQSSAAAPLVQKWCEHQYGPGTWQAVDGVGELTGLNVCNKVGTPVMSTLNEMRKIVVTESNLVQTTFLGFDISMEAPELVTPTTKIGIPGVFFTNINKETHITTDEFGASWLNIPFLGEFISAIYKYSVGLISLIAVMVLIISGVQIITSAGNSEAISSAKHRIVSSVIAIIVTAGSYTILYTVNPDSVNLKNLKILVVPEDELSSSHDHGNLIDDPEAGSKAGLDVEAPPCRSAASPQEAIKLSLSGPKFTSNFTDFEKFSCGNRSLEQIQYLIIHEGARSLQGTINILKKRTLSTHFIIDRNGDILQTVDIRRRAYHAGQVNAYSIGIDLVITPVVPGMGDNNCNQSGACVGNRECSEACTYTDAQYQSLNQLINHFRMSVPSIGFKFSDATILAHCQLHDATHGDIRNFDWKRIGLDSTKHRKDGDIVKGKCIKDSFTLQKNNELNKQFGGRP